MKFICFYKGFEINKTRGEYSVSPVDNPLHQFFFDTQEECVEAIDSSIESGLNLAYFE
jgi:hypothetical protein